MKTTDFRFPEPSELNALLNSYTESSRKVLPAYTYEIRREERTALDELNAMIGMDTLKCVINKQLSYARIMNLRKNSGRKVPKRIMNMILCGNAGTGKTTAARLIGHVFHDAGLLSKGHTVEVNRAKLVGRYIGESEAITSKYIAEAQGGVLFIDEAYNLTYSDDTRDFGTKVIDSLLPCLSENDDMIVIGAGYTDRISEFLKANPGLASRFPIIVECPDFSVGQMLEIAEKKLADLDFVLSDDAKGAMERLIIKASHIADFGNARFINTLIDDHVIPSLCGRIGHRISDSNVIDSETAAAMDLIIADDIPPLEAVFPLEKTNRKRTVGF